MPLRILVIGTRTSSAPAGNSIAWPAVGLDAAEDPAPPADAGAPLDAGTADAAAADGAAGAAGLAPVRRASTKAMTSSRVIRPPPPVPGIWSGCRSCSRRRRRTAGVIRALGSWAAGADATGAAAGAAAGADAAGADAGAAAASAAAGAVAVAAAAATGACSGSDPVSEAEAGAVADAPASVPSSSVSMTAISALLGTVSPSWARISFRHAGEG